MLEQCQKVESIEDLSALTDAYLEGVKEMLFYVEHTTDHLSNRVQLDRSRLILDKLSDQLGPLRNKGFSFPEISSILHRCKVKLPAHVIEDYYHQMQDKRLQRCEQLIADHYKPEWNAVIERTALIERGLRQALDDECGLVLHYQPQVNIHTGEVIGAEALVRWKFNGSLVPPSDFIPVAECSGLIVPIGEWVLREACKEAKLWQSMGLGGERGIKVGVNLSVKQFSDTLPDMVHGVLCDTGLPTNRLGLEITESFLVGNDLSILNTLRDSGILLSIDDFGTGYSCLSQLKDLPLDTIKIDRAFVQDIELGGSAPVIVETIIDLANKLGMKTLAEGVETEGQVTVLREKGCSVCQGFLYSKPLPGAEFIDFVNGRDGISEGGGIRWVG